MEVKVITKKEPARKPGNHCPWLIDDSEPQRTAASFVNSGPSAN